MDTKTYEKLSYGLFVLTASKNGKDNGCIINTVTQVASNPDMIAISVNNANFTCEMIKKSGMFTVSVISTDADFELFKHFGFQSGRDTDKFAGYEHARRAESGQMIVTKGTNAYISAYVKEVVELPSHIVFIARVTDAEVLSDVPSATYAYYHANIKPKKQAAPAKEDKTVWRCKICGYEYEGENLPEDYICPLCKHPASDFEKA